MSLPFDPGEVPAALVPMPATGEADVTADPFMGLLVPKPGTFRLYAAYITHTFASPQAHGCTVNTRLGTGNEAWNGYG